MHVIFRATRWHLSLLAVELWVAVVIFDLPNGLTLELPYLTRFLHSTPFAETC